MTTPVAGAFLALALFAWALSGLGRTSVSEVAAKAAAGSLMLASTAALPLIFPGAGYFPFPVGDMVVVVVIAAALAAPLLRAPPAVRVGAAIYGLVSIALFSVPTPMGDNDARLAAYVGVPLLLCYLPRAMAGWREPAQAGPGRRPGPNIGHLSLVGAVALVMVVWDWGPIAETFNGAVEGPPSVASYYRPLVNELQRLSGGWPVRVEIPPLAHHWEAAYVAPRFPLARGWERQIDMAYNDLFYRQGPLGRREYRTWLISNGVSYVAVPVAPFDYGGEKEAVLVRSGTVPGLQLVWRAQGWELWKVLGSQGLASAPGRVASIAPGTVAVRFSRAGVSVVKVRWSRYWTLPRRDGGSACLERSAGDWTELSSDGQGLVRLTTSVLHPDHGRCIAVVRPDGVLPSKLSD